MGARDKAVISASPTVTVRPWLKVVATVLIPLALFLVAELALRLAGVGHSADFFIPDEQPGSFRTNPRFMDLYLPPSFGLKPLNYRIQKIKPTGSKRVFVVGESAAMGFPEPGFGVVPQLRAQLTAAHPTENFEVYNLGMTAINSHVLRRVVEQAVDFEPDILVIYMGNNEVVGPYGPGSMTAGAIPPLWLIRASLWVREFRMAQAIEGLLHRIARRGTFKEWRGMELFASGAISPLDPRMQKVYANFDANLADMIKTAEKAGVKTIVSTVAVNLRDSPPFASRHREGMSADELRIWQADARAARIALAAGDTGKARSALERGLALDPNYAESRFLLGQVLEEVGDLSGARREFVAALNNDWVRFRTDPAENDIVRTRVKAASPDLVSLVDAARELGSDARSGGPISGRESFFEHVHFSWKGNHRLARLLAQEVSRRLFGELGSTPRWMDDAEAAAVHGFTAFGELTLLRRMNELTARPPFTAQYDFAAERGLAESQGAKLEAQLAQPADWEVVLQKVESARLRNPTPFLTFHLAAIHAQLGQWTRALALNDELAALEPLSPERIAQRAFLLQRLGRREEAEKLLLESAARDPFYIQTYGLLGNLWAENKEISKARTFFENLVEKMPANRTARQILARFYGPGDESKAEAQWRAVLDMAPDDEDALVSLVERLYRTRRSEEALAVMLRAYRYNDRNFANASRLEQIYEEKGDAEKTVEFMIAMAESGPVRPVLFADLAERLLQARRSEEAELYRVKGLRAARLDHDDALVLRLSTLSGNN